MKNCDEMVSSLLERRDRYVVERKKRRRMITGISCSAACCALILCALPLFRRGAEQALPAPTEAVATENVPSAAPAEGTPSASAAPTPAEISALPTPAVTAAPAETAAPGETAAPSAPDAGPELLPEGHGEPVFVPETGETQPPISGGEAEFIAMWWWKKKLTVSGALRVALEDEPDVPHEVRGIYRPTTEALNGVTDFVYEGKTLAEWVAEAEYEWRLATLIREGGAMKYGTALYETGTPDGQQWTKAQYDFLVGYIGEELLARYIVGGELLTEQLESDYAACGGRADAKYGEVVEAYTVFRCARAAEALTAAGIPAEVGAYGEWPTVDFSADAAQMENLPLDDIAYWWFI